MKKFLVTLALLLIPLSSHALFEVRAGYGNNTLDEDLSNGYNVDNGSGFNIDAIFEPPLITDLGIGLRYESMKYDFSGAANGDTQIDRLALLLDYKFIDLFVYFGVIGTFDLNTDVEDSLSSLNPDAKTFWSAGVEGGLNLGLIHVGAELGKLFGTIERAGQADQKMDGLYGKVLVGFGF